MTAGSETAGREFWAASGFRLLDRDAEGRLVASDDYLRAYLDRPELRPQEDSSAAELALHGRLMETPRRAVAAAEIERIADPDARENYRLLVEFRDGLLAHPSLEAFYLACFRAGPVAIPPLFLDQLVHVLLRGILDGCDDPFRARAGELLFRRQKASLVDGAIMLADEDVVELYARTGGRGPLGRLIAEAEGLRGIDLDVLDESSAQGYWARSDRFDMVLDVSFARPGIDALCRVLEAWIRHFLAVEVAIQPVQSIADERWSWHVGLDGEATLILNDLYRGAEVEEPRLARLLSLFRLEFREPALALPRLAGRPVYLAMAMTPANELRLKPQNLLVNLPLGPAG